MKNSILELFNLNHKNQHAGKESSKLIAHIRQLERIESSSGLDKSRFLLYHKFITAVYFSIEDKTKQQ